MRICAKPEIMSERSEKLFNGPNQTRFRLTGLFHLRERIVTEKPFTQESFDTKSLRVERRNTFPKVREGDNCDILKVLSLAQIQRLCNQNNGPIARSKV